MKLGEIKIKFMKVTIFKKKKLFVEDSNTKVTKVEDFNSNFPIIFLR